MKRAAKKAASPVTINFSLAPRPLLAPWHVERLVHGSVRLVANKDPGPNGLGDDVGFNCAPSDTHRVAAIELAARAVNAHKDLVGALRSMLAIAEGLEEFHDGAEGTDARMLAEAAIAKAEEGSRHG